MKVEMRISSLFTIAAEGNTHKELFHGLNSLAENFSIDKCGACGRQRLIPVVRTVGKFTYYEFKCRDCFAKLSFGQSTEGGALYPRRKYHKDHPMVKAGEVNEGDKIPNGGWEVWKPEEEDGVERVVPAPQRPQKKATVSR